MAGSGTHTVRVVDRRDVASSVVELELAAVDGGALPAWTPGAHVDVMIRPGVVRQYSLCGPRATSRFRIAVLREPEGRGGSKHLHDHVGLGDRLTLTAPRNTFPLDPGRPALLVAGGIGITPLLSMIEELEAHGTSWELHYGGRSPATMAYVEDLAQHGPRLHLYPQDGCGVLPLDDLVGRARSMAAVVYACGPPGMLAALRSAVGDTGDVELVVEQFTAPAPVAGAETGFTVTAVQSGVTFEVGPDEVLLDLLEDHGLDVMSSCRSGVCGTCEVAVLDGRPDHRDTFLTSDEREAGTCLLPCVSRALTPHLDLDL